MSMELVIVKRAAARVQPRRGDNEEHLGGEGMKPPPPAGRGAASSEASASTSAAAGRASTPAAVKETAAETAAAPRGEGREQVRHRGVVAGVNEPATSASSSVELEISSTASTPTTT